MTLRICWSLVLLSALLLPVPPRVEDPVRVVWSDVAYLFGETIHFTARFETEAIIESAALAYLSPGRPVQHLPFNFPETLETRLALEKPREHLQPFTTVYYWFEFDLADGQSVTSPSFSFAYQDNRFDWEYKESPHVKVYWHDAERAFGEEALRVARQGLSDLEDLIPLVPLETPLEIYIYREDQALQAVLPHAGGTWAAAYSLPEQGLAVVTVSPGAGARLEMEREIPHELAHLMLYQINPHGYQHLPVWLVEGLATAAETYPNSAYTSALEEALTQKETIPLENLCTALPRDPAHIELAYAESASFVRYLHNRYGTSGLRTLLGHYHDGKGCSQALTAAFGHSLDDLEEEWLATQPQIGGEETPAESKLGAAALLCGSILLPLVIISSYIWFKMKRTQRKAIP